MADLLKFVQTKNSLKKKERLLRRSGKVHERLQGADYENGQNGKGQDPPSGSFFS